MPDPRIEKLANVLINYSLALKKDDLTVITGGPLGEPLLLALYKTALEAGAHPHLHMTSDNLDELLLNHGSDDQLHFVSPLLLNEIETIDAWVRVRAEFNTKQLTGADPQKQTLLAQGRHKSLERRIERAAEGKLRWNGTQYPTPASAQDAGMSLTEYQEFIFNAGLLHYDDPVAAWREVGRKQQVLVDLLNTKKNIRVEADNGTDLTMSTNGRKWINCCGTKNFPDGEVFTAPVEDSINGTICYSFPAVHLGRECDGVVFRFEKGRVVEATATQGEEFLLNMLDMDSGARGVGEFAIGTNYGITQYTKNTLFDEKIGGTVHLAVGATYPETGGANKSGLHWDMVCDLRPGGRITVDSETLLENGKFTTIDI